MEEDIWKKNMEEKYVFDPVFYDVSLYVLERATRTVVCVYCSHVVAAVEQIILYFKKINYTHTYVTKNDVLCTLIYLPVNSKKSAI